jgi:hypothetical protein
MGHADRKWIAAQVDMIASLCKRDRDEVWGEMYTDFGYRHNIHFRRIAFTTDRKTIDVIEAEGLLADFGEFVQGRLKEKTPALPVQKEKAPVQGSLLEGEQ